MRSLLMAKTEKYLAYLCGLIIVTGVILRLILYFQPHDLNIDEANVVRNLAERGFTGLLQPLNYYQYAPPVFLWAEKLSTICLGFGEKAAWLYPLLCGIAALPVFYRILYILLRPQGHWLPLAIMAFGIIYVKYSVQVKQYMPDVLVTLLLVWLALVVVPGKSSKAKFLLTWLLAGSVAIWSSMPSVFILAGIGAYQLYLITREKKKAYVLSLCGTWLVWAMQFFLYYHFMLRSQINSDYLQNFHRPYFLFALPVNGTEWAHNGDRLLNVFGAIGGYTGVAVAANMVFFVTGIVKLLKYKKDKAILLLLPVLLVIAAAALHQFSLIERVILFMMPLVLIVIGYGLEWLLDIHFRAAKIVLAAAGIITVAGYNMFPVFVSRYLFQEITPGLDYLVRQKAAGRQLYVHNATTDTYIYYTQLHPDRARWQSLQGAHLLTWDDDYSKLPIALGDTAYVLYTGIEPAELQQRKNALSFLQQTGAFEPGNHTGETVCYVYKYVRRQ